jgi:hypothetical protein
MNRIDMLTILNINISQSSYNYIINEITNKNMKLLAKYKIGKKEEIYKDNTTPH